MREQIAALWNQIGGRAYLVPALLIAVSLAGCIGPNSVPAQGVTAPTRAAEIPTPVPTLAKPTPIPSNTFKHVFIIVMENRDYGEIIGSKNAPYINQLAQDYAVAAQYYGIRHPSLPNYLALISGSTQGMATDCSDCAFDAPNLADQLQASNKSWKAYIEDAPSPCFNGQTSNNSGPKGQPLYTRKHNPWMYFNSVADDPTLCGRDVPLTELDTDLAKGQLPDLTWISPNIIHSMHDGSVQDGDNWLASLVPKILDSPEWKDDGVLFLLFDEGKHDEECCEYASGGKTVALVVAPHGKKGYASDTQYTHYSVLRTIEDAWGLELLGGAGDSRTNIMSEFFK